MLAGRMNFSFSVTFSHRSCSLTVPLISTVLLLSLLPFLGKLKQNTETSVTHTVHLMGKMPGFCVRSHIAY